jgi:probable rRNA maturation factor
MYNIKLETTYEIKAAALRAGIGAVMRQHNLREKTGLSILLTDDDHVHELNRDFRGVDAPTDVLSFPAELPDLPGLLAEDARYLGDLIIAYPYSQAQAARLGHALDDTLVLLVIHGTLHLLGYEHDTPANRNKMWAAQGQALDAVGVSRSVVPALEEAPHDE